MDIHGVFYLYVVAEQATKVFLSLSIEPLLICCIALIELSGRSYSNDTAIRGPYGAYNFN
jgi:hypothetical protein